MEELIKTFVEVKLKTSDDFLKVVETLTRIGVASRKNNTLTQSCHILHKKSKYYIVHFKELLMLDGNETNFNDEDRQRRNKIAALLEQWKLVEVIVPEIIKEQSDIAKIKIVSYADKDKFVLKQKYNIGKFK